MLLSDCQRLSEKSVPQQPKRRSFVSLPALYGTDAILPLCDRLIVISNAPAQCGNNLSIEHLVFGAQEFALRCVVEQIQHLQRCPHRCAGLTVTSISRLRHRPARLPRCSAREVSVETELIFAPHRYGAQIDTASSSRGDFARYDASASATVLLIPQLLSRMRMFRPTRVWDINIDTPYLHRGCFPPTDSRRRSSTPYLRQIWFAVAVRPELASIVLVWQRDLAPSPYCCLPLQFAAQIARCAREAIAQVL